MAGKEQPRIAILGAGPIGLEAALYAAFLKLPFTIYERGRIGEHMQQWGHVRLFSPFGMNVTPLGLDRVRAENPGHNLPADNDIVTGREHVEAYLEPLGKSTMVRDHIKAETPVLRIGRRGLLKSDLPGDPARGKQPFRLLVRSGNGERMDEADVILDCTGTYGQPRWIGDGGIPATGEAAARAHIAGGLEDVLGEKRGLYADKTVLVMGGGYTAAATVCNLAALAKEAQGTWCIWLARSSKTQPIRRFPSDPFRERDQLATRANTLATRTDDNVEYHPASAVDAIEHLGPDKGFKVTARCQNQVKTWDVDRVIGNVGYTPYSELYRELQVHECYASLGPMSLASVLLKHGGGDCLTVPAQGPAALKTPEPNFYILGAKSFGRNSNFLLRTGFDQVRDAFTLITGKSDLDLYKKLKF